MIDDGKVSPVDALLSTWRTRRRSASRTSSSSHGFELRQRFSRGLGRGNGKITGAQSGRLSTISVNNRDRCTSSRVRCASWPGPGVQTQPKDSSVQPIGQSIGSKNRVPAPFPAPAFFAEPGWPRVPGFTSFPATGLLSFAAELPMRDTLLSPENEFSV